MKKFLILAVVSFFYTGCATYVTVMNDPYTSEVVVKYEERLKVIEGPLSNGRTCFSRTIKKGIKSPVRIELEIDGMTGSRTGYHGEELDESAHILVDNVSFPIKLAERKKDKDLHIYGHELGHGTIGEGIAGKTVDMHSTISASLNFHCYLKAKIVSTPELEKAMVNAKKMSIRLSTGGKYIILKPTGSQLEMIRELVAFTPEQK